MLKPKANEFIMLAVQFILDNLNSPNVNYLAQVLHRIFLNHTEHCPFYTRQSKEELPDQFLKHLPGGLNTTVGSSANDVDTSTMTPEAISTMWRSLDNWTRFQRNERATSPLYFVNVNYFGEIGGFSRVFDYLQGEKELGLWTLKLLTKVICVMRYSLSLKFLKLFLPSFVDLVCQRLLNWFGVNLKIDLRTHYEDTLEFLVTLMKEIMPEDAATQRIDAYTLEGCLTMFNTDNLEKRLRGLRDLKTLIDRTQKEERRFGANIGKFFTGTQEEEDDKKKKKLPRIPPKVIMAWLEKNNFLDHFFHMLKSHIEILRQGTPILIFVAQQGQLKLEHIASIWAMAANMHEHDKRILNSSLVALVPHLPPAHLDHLITQISDSPLRLIDEQSVELIVSLTTLSVAANTKHKWNGLELLWLLCQDPTETNKSGNVSTRKGKDGKEAGAEAAAAAPSAPSDVAAVSAATSASPKAPRKKDKDAAVASAATSSGVTTIDPLLAHKAFTRLCELLSTEECAPQRPIYMERCFNNIDEHESIALSIEILRRCIEAYPTRRRKKAVTDLESKKKLLTLIFEDFQFYHSEAKRTHELQVVLRRSAVETNAAPAAAASNDDTGSSPAPAKKKKKKRTSTAVPVEGEKTVEEQVPVISRPETPGLSLAPRPLDVNTMIVLGRPHLENVTQRLFFLEYVIQNAALVMRIEQVDSIWDLFISQALSTEEREAAFGWLERASNATSESGAVLGEQQLQHLFTNKMLTTSGNAFTGAGYQLFERYFGRINDRLGKVKIGEERTGKAVGLVASDATGLEKLWEIALENNDRTVSSGAIAYLNQLHLNLELFMNRSKAAKIREAYVNTALQKLMQASSENAEEKMERCLKLLSECVLDFEEIKGESALVASANAGAAGSPSLLSGWTFGDMFAGGSSKRKGGAGLATTVKIFLKSPSKSPQRLVLNSQTTIKSLSEKAIELFNFDIYDNLKLTLEGDKENTDLSKDTDKTLGELKVPDDATILVRKGIDAIEGTNNDGIYVFSALLQGLTLGVGGLGAQTDKVRQIITRAENSLKATLAAQGSSSNAVAAITAKGKLSASTSSGSSVVEPMFPPIQRSALYREIRVNMNLSTANDLKVRDLHPARILCTPEHFNKLYALLGTANGELGESLWELLSVLPSSDATKTELFRISTVDHVVAAFPADRPFQLLYNLQLIEPMISKAIDSANPKSKKANGGDSAPSSPRGNGPVSPRGSSSSSSAQQSSVFDNLDAGWINLLLNAGLLEHLLDIFFSVKTSSSLRKSIGMMKLLPQLIRVINMLSLKIKEERDLPSHISSINLSRSLSGRSSRNPNQGRYELTDQREHFRTNGAANGNDLDSFGQAIVERIIKFTSLLSCSSAHKASLLANLDAADERSDAESRSEESSSQALPHRLPGATVSRDLPMEDEALIIQEALVLLVPVVAASRSALDHLLRHPKFRSWLVSLVLQSPSLRVREAAVRAVSDLISSAPSVSNKVAEQARAASGTPSPAATAQEAATQLSLLLLEMLLPAALEDSRILDLFSQSCEELFLTIEILLRDVAATPYFESTSKSKSTKKPVAHPVLVDLLHQLSARIKSRPVVEKFAVDGQEDKILMGLMHLVYSIVHRDGAATAGQKTRPALYKPACHSLVKELFHNCLFTIPTVDRRGPDAPPKCKTKASRAVGYKLLTELCSHCDRNLQSVLNLLQEQVHMIDMREDYNFYAARNEKSATGYVGLQNQGATCYMNATMQQLFMVSEFRRGVLSVTDPSFDNPLESVLSLPPEKKPVKRGMRLPRDDSSSSDSDSEEAPISWTPETAVTRLEKESILYQLQRMFGYLQEGERRSFETKPFCYAYKDFEGNPINTSQQMDANEYFNRLFDSIESKLRGTAQAQLLKDIFGGKYANQLLGTGEECSHRRESTEPFFSISVDIKHKTTLQESLKSFTEGEVLGGDNKPQCPKCNKNVDTLKRCLMHTLPPILVVHLKRFEFHYEQMRHFKLNSSCSFPMELDMEPYMRESHAAKENAKSKAAGGSGANDEGDAAPAEEEGETLSDLINLAQARKAAGYYDYELSGVVVHVGSSDAGHYYSFIKERPNALPPGRVRDSTVGSKWFEFNDSYVTEFDPAKIPVECFGGEDEVLEWADEARTTKRAVKRPRTNNAYILIYTRKNSQLPSLEGLPIQAIQASAAAKDSSDLHDHPISAATASNSEHSQKKPKVIEEEEDDASISEDTKESVKVEEETQSSEPSSPKEKVAAAAAAAPPADLETSHANGHEASADTPQDNSPSAASDAPADPKVEENGSDEKTKPAEGDAASTDVVVASAPVAIIKPRGAREIFATIYEENRDFLIRRYLFDSEYFAFVWSIVNANLPPLPPRTLDEIRSTHEETQRKVDQQRMMRERQELERETNSFPSPFVPRPMNLPPNMNAPPGPRQLTVGSGATAIKIEVRAMNHTSASLKQEEARMIKLRKEEEARRAKEKPLDADEQKLEQERKMDAADKAAKDKEKEKDKESKDKKSKDKDDPTTVDKTAKDKTSSGKSSKKDKNAATNGEPSNGSSEVVEESSSSSEAANADLTIFALDFIKNIYVRARETPLLNLWLNTLYRLFSANVTQARILLRSLIQNQGELAQVLIQSNSEKARNCYAQMIVSALRALRQQECGSYLTTARALKKTRNNKNADATSWREPESYCVWFLEELWKLQRFARKNHFDAFFHIFSQFANFGIQERDYLLKRGFLVEFLMFALWFEPGAVNSPTRISTPRFAARELPAVSEVVCVLLMASDAETPTDDEDETVPQPPTSLNPLRPYALQPQEHEASLSAVYGSLMMREDVNSHAMGRIYCHFMYNNKEMSTFVFSHIFRGIVSAAIPSQTKGFIDVLCYIVRNLDDTLQSERFDMIIKAFPQWIHKYNTTRRAGVERIIQSFFIMASLHPLFRSKVMHAKTSLNNTLESAGYRIL